MSITTVGLSREEMTDRLSRYRDFHNIVPTRIPELDRWVCLHDSIRILPKAGNDWRHDPDEIKALSEGADLWDLSTRDMKRKRPQRSRKINLPIVVDDDLKAAIGHRLGKDRATESEIRNTLDGALSAWLEDVMYEWREGKARPAEEGEGDG